MREILDEARTLRKKEKKEQSAQIECLNYAMIHVSPTYTDQWTVYVLGSQR